MCVCVFVGQEYLDTGAVRGVAVGRWEVGGREQKTGLCIKSGKTRSSFLFVQKSSVLADLELSQCSLEINTNVQGNPQEGSFS